MAKVMTRRTRDGYEFTGEAFGQRVATEVSDKTMDAMPTDVLVAELLRQQLVLIEKRVNARA